MIWYMIWIKGMQFIHVKKFIRGIREKLIFYKIKLVTKLIHLLALNPGLLKGFASSTRKKTSKCCSFRW